MHDISLILTIAAGLAGALVFGLLTQRLGLSPIVGYLLAGVAIGPHTPGFVADAKLAAQLAEMGVILLMFGVGLHFHLKDLLAVKALAIPGAVGQSLAATGLGAAVAVASGWPLSAGLVLGMAVSVASTVVLLRVLMDANMLNTPHGHAAVGWLVVEDIFTVLVLVLLPAVAQASAQEGGSVGALAQPLLLALLKLAALTAVVLVGGARVIPWLLGKVAQMRSRELFTLTVLAVAIGIAAGSYIVFGASMALGAFLAGMVVGQSEVHHQAAADALPMRDAFAVLFFVSVGMLFDPGLLVREPALVLAVLGIVLVGKPLAALLIVVLLGYPVRTALTVAIGLAQIGEFSFIVGDVAGKLGLLPSAGSSVLVAAALLSITLNPLLFRALPRIENWLRARPRLWKLLNARNANEQAQETDEQPLAALEPESVRAIVVGYGPVGRTLTRILREFGIQPVIVETNVETVRALHAEGLNAVYGDAGRREILEAAGVMDARYLLVTLPDVASRVAVIAAGRMLNPSLRIHTRAHYLGERAMLDDAGATQVAFEEAEVAVALAGTLLKEIGAPEPEIAARAERIRDTILGRHQIEPLEGALPAGS